MIFTDNTTGKQYSINGNTVTQARNGSVLSVTVMEDVAGWMGMMGFKAHKEQSFVVTGIKTRNKHAKSYFSIIRAMSKDEAMKIAKRGTQGLVDVKAMTHAEYDLVKGK
jgi:hypothetical protein